MTLKCKNPECESHENDQYQFNANVVFDRDRALAENIRKVEAHYFECCFCGEEAEDVEAPDLITNKE